MSFLLALSPDVARSIAWVGIVTVVFFGYRRLYLHNPVALLHPVILSTVTIILLLLLTGYSRSEFRMETRPIVWLLGPAVVSLGVPVWNRRSLIARNWRALGVAIGGSLVVSSFSLLIFDWINLDVARAMAVRSTTLPIALAVATPFGTPADLVVVATMVSALTGLIGGPALLAGAGLGGGNLECGIALGCASHALGTTRALEEGETAGAFASVAMGLSAIAYGLIMPIILTTMTR